MSFRDRELTCAECGRQFTFTARDQAYHAERGFTNDPRRCPDCRAARRTERGERGAGNGGAGWAGGYGGGRGSDRPMYDVTCANCGKQTQVPFQPRGDRPVYCSDCFRQQGGGYGGGYGGGGRGGGGRGGGGGGGGRGGR